MSYTINELYVGQSSSFSKTITESDVYLFAGITGDFNPAHLNAEYAKNTAFQERIVHGMLSASMISTILGTGLPGEGTIYTGQEIKFLSPVYFGDTITVTAEVKEIISERNRVILHTYAVNQDGKTVLDGEATVMPPKTKQ
ncbi:3-hydroxybutyryl-CoA dehydratase [Dethiosulfatibacter aminovorans DSM 17477]|uniref:3-hydroxybutyryl-CoA dehydratase n=1 Tax=Dethiosulfatibacter aminovorans DSM 17477 TaxID=1121476 RepID=A0A1M6ENX1_9FIRM|nr:MaoC family dehydratase [Dethiosulfatibacter aminovorans]SHI87058.1 3-hydroxybutyryl-CoA dehydratase [Dethiosulfatibacter aminovorans DSM 17477]